MSFLKKLFSAKADDRREIKPRAPRVSVTPLHRLQFKSQDAKCGLGNLSTTGMAVFRDVGPNWTDGWHLGDTVHGVLRVDQNEFSVSAVIRHISSTIAGFEFISPPLTVIRAIEAYLRIEILALSLRRVDPAYMKKDPRGDTHWFTDGRQNELFIIADAKGVIAFHMTFMGNYIEGGRDRALKGGIVNEQEDGQLHKGSALVDVSRKLPAEMAAIAVTYVQHVDALPLSLREDLAAKLQH
jgi:PilZ domain